MTQGLREKEDDMRYDRRMMPTGRLGQITIRGVEFEVYATEDPEWLLFSPMIPMGDKNNPTFVSSTIHIPTKISDLKPGWWRGLH
jgi:hypothetical protein